MSGFSIPRAAMYALSVALTVTAIPVIALLMGSHTPFRIADASSGAEERRTGRWRAVYVLGSDCPCSRLVAKHLSTRSRMRGIDEQVVFVGGGEEKLLLNQGWPLVRWPAERARAVYGALSAPLLVVVDPAGNIRYSGGFARRSDFRDGFHETEISASVRAGRNPARLPAYGCALQFGGCGTDIFSQAAKQLEVNR